MSCCAKHVGSAQRCFGLLSKLYARRYRRKGLEKLQLELVGQLRTMGFEDKSLLEVGCGVGALHQTLLEQGAARAVGVDLADDMLVQARERAEQLGLAERVAYELGDFVDVHGKLEPADITLLDKVVCCYPAPKALLDAAVSRTGHAIALTYPRKRFLTKLSCWVWNLAFWLLRSHFRTFVHDPEAIEIWLRSLGLDRASAHESFMWHAEVYVLRS